LDFDITNFVDYNKGTELKRNIFMLTSDDIKNLTTYQLDVFKDTFATKDDVKDLKEEITGLRTSVDNMAKEVRAYYQEMAVLMHKVERMESWIKQVSVKVGVGYNT
jgi:hypothetical protein